MIKGSQCCADKGVPINPPDAVEAPVETNSNSKDDHNNDHHDDLDDKISSLPTEILVLIFNSLDIVSLFHCYFVSKRWRSIVFSIAYRDETNMIWYFLYSQYQMEGYNYQQNTDSSCLESSLKWNSKYSIKLSISVPVIDAVQMTLYRDNIIVVTSAGVQYFDKETFQIKKEIKLDKCYHFIENDYMVAKSIKHSGTGGTGGYRLKLFGKRSFDDCQWESQISTSGTTHTNTTNELIVQLFKIEDNCCFVVTKRNTLYSYHWKHSETPIEWIIRFRCCSKSRDVIRAMNVGRTLVYLLSNSGALYCYQRNKIWAIKKKYTYCGVMDTRLIQLVHRTNLVLNVPYYCESYFTRIRKSGVQTMYRLGFRKLTCVTEHGIFLFLGYSDGKVKIIHPMDSSRKHITKYVIDLSEFNKELPHPIVTSIVIHVDNGKQSIYVATTACVYRLTATFLDENNIWDKENRIGLIQVPRVDQVSI